MLASRNQEFEEPLIERDSGIELHIVDSRAGTFPAEPVPVRFERVEVIAAERVGIGVGVRAGFRIDQVDLAAERKSDFGPVEHMEEHHIMTGMPQPVEGTEQLVLVSQEVGKDHDQRGFFQHSRRLRQRGGDIRRPPRL